MSLDRIRYKEQRDTITSLKERLEADSVSVNTMGAGSVLVRFWKEGDCCSRRLVLQACARISSRTLDSLH